MSPPEKNEASIKYDIVYDGRTATWEYRIDWMRWLYRDPELYHYAAMYAGLLPEIPKPGQYFLLTMENGDLTLHEIMRVDAGMDPPFLFFCDAVMHGVVSEIEEIDDGRI